MKWPTQRTTTYDDYGCKTTAGASGFGACDSKYGVVGVDGWGQGTYKVYDAEQGYKAQHIGETYTTTNGTVYDAHYLLGNYYQWNTASAGMGEVVTTQGEEVKASICPAGAENDKNWMLPLSGYYAGEGTVRVNNTVNGSFYYMLNLYGVISESGHPVGTAMMQFPLSFVRSGKSSSGNIAGVGYDGYYWSRVSAGYSASERRGWGYGLSFGTGDSYPTSSSDNTWYIKPVRCLYPGK